MNTMKYKGFIGSVNYNEADGVFSGKIEGIDGLVTFEGAGIQELTEEFHKAVEDYLIFCKEQGLSPKKSYRDAEHQDFPRNTQRHRRLCCRIGHHHQCVHQARPGKSG